jgi:hypothetical protein
MTGLRTEPQSATNCISLFNLFNFIVSGSSTQHGQKRSLPDDNTSPKTGRTVLSSNGPQNVDNALIHTGPLKEITRYQ